MGIKQKRRDASKWGQGIVPWEKGQVGTLVMTTDKVNEWVVFNDKLNPRRSFTVSLFCWLLWHAEGYRRLILDHKLRVVVMTKERTWSPNNTVSCNKTNIIESVCVFAHACMHMHEWVQVKYFLLLSVQTKSCMTD